MKTCTLCGTEFDPTKDTFITVSERKSASVDFDRIECAATYLSED